MSAEERVRALMMRHHHAVKNRQQSLLGRAAAEIGFDVDNNYRGHIQGKPQSNFQSTYDRSRASLS